MDMYFNLRIKVSASDRLTLKHKNDEFVTKIPLLRQGRPPSLDLDLGLGFAISDAGLEQPPTTTGKNSTPAPPTRRRRWPEKPGPAGHTPTSPDPLPRI